MITFDRDSHSARALRELLSEFDRGINVDPRMTTIAPLVFVNTKVCAFVHTRILMIPHRGCYHAAKGLCQLQTFVCIIDTLANLADEEFVHDAFVFGLRLREFIYKIDDIECFCRFGFVPRIFFLVFSPACFFFGFSPALFFLDFFYLGFFYSLSSKSSWLFFTFSGSAVLSCPAFRFSGNIVRSKGSCKLGA